MQNDKKKSFFLLKILLVQAAVMVVILGLLFAVKKLNPSDYKAVAEKYVDIADTKSGEKAATDAWSKIKAFLVDDNKSTSQKNAGGKDEDVNGNKYPDNCSASKYIISAEICRPASGKISSPFGYRINPVTQKLSFHTGLDIAAPNGSDVKAAYYGIVEKAGKNEVYGNCITINHGNGIKTFYAHCSKLFVKTGEVVNGGDKIALVGSTGWSTGPHLHFSIIIDGIYYNPAFVIK